MDKYNISYMILRIDEYVEENKSSILILKECCLLNKWDYDYVMKLQSRAENQMLRQSIKKLLDTKEVQLIKAGLTGQVDKAMAMFILKQPAHGYTNADPITELEEKIKKQQLEKLKAETDLAKIRAKQAKKELTSEASDNVVNININYTDLPGDDPN